MKPDVENFCTLFDQNYLPLGITLHQSLMKHASPFHLWILCMDQAVEQQLEKLALAHVTIVPLSSVETPEILSIKPGRSQGEYCWTMTPSSIKMVFDRDASVHRVTYLDADLFFFDDPRILISELEKAQKQVLITDHAYAPQYDQSADSGRFCVQFVTFSRQARSLALLDRWRSQCIEWCFNRSEPGRFGDQKYLDDWPEKFSETVHICQQTNKTLAPWNVRFFANAASELSPVFYHFHGLRLISPNLVRLYTKYKIGKKGKAIYDVYSQSLAKSFEQLRAENIPIPYIPADTNKAYRLLKYLKQIATRETRFITVGSL